MRKFNSFVRYQAAESDAGVSGNTEVTQDSAVVVVPISFNAKYKKDKDGKPQMQIVQVKNEKTQQMENVEQKIVDVPAKTVKALLTAPKFSELTPDILSSLYNDRLESVAKSYIKGEAEESLVNGAEFSYTISPADLLGERVEISEELEEKAKTAFMQYLATQGKTDKAQKNNALLMSASVTTLSTRDQRIIDAYEGNLTKFIEVSSADLIAEIEPVLTRANRRLERAKNQDIGNLI